MNTLEIIEEMNTNPALAEDLRAVILTRDLLRLPADVATIDERLDKLVQISARHEETLAQLVESTKKLEETTAHLAQTSQRHEVTLAQLVESTKKLEETTAHLAQTSQRHEETLAHLAQTSQRHEETLAQLVESTKKLEETTAHLAQTSQRHEETLAQLAQTSQRHEETLAQLVESTKKLEETTAQLVRIVKDHDDRLGYLMGSDLESKWRINAAAYLGNIGFRKVNILEKGELAELLFELLDNGDINEPDRIDILCVDSVATAITKSDLSKVYVVTEIASRIHKDDIDRVTRRAEKLQQATAVKCLKVVAGASIDETANELALKNDILVVIPSDWVRKYLNASETI